MIRLFLLTAILMANMMTMSRQLFSLASVVAVAQNYRFSFLRLEVLKRSD